MVKCPICETCINVGGFSEVYISPFNNQEYKKYECPNCDVHWWEPLKIIPEFYEKEIFDIYTVFHEGIRSELRENHKAFFWYFPKEIKGKLLDIGCGDGVFLKKAYEAGFEVFGIDFDSKSVEVAKKSIGVDTIYAMSLKEFYNFSKKNKLKFDVITFFEVLEHQDNPKEFLEMVKELLKENGYIAGSVPNRDRLFKDVDWRYFYFDYPPHHFLRFSKKALENTFKIFDFKNIEVYKLDFPKEVLPAYIEKKYLGNLDNIKKWIKRKIIGNRKLADTFSIEDLGKKERFLTVKSLKILKSIRNALLLPVSLPYWRKLKGNGIYLYFQASKG